MFKLVFKFKNKNKNKNKNSIEFNALQKMRTNVTSKNNYATVILDKFDSKMIQYSYNHCVHKIVKLG